MGSAWQLKMKQHSVLHSDPKTNTFCSKNSHQYCNMTFTAHIKIRNKYSNRTRVGSFNILTNSFKKEKKKLRYLQNYTEFEKSVDSSVLYENDIETQIKNQYYEKEKEID